MDSSQSLRPRRWLAPLVFLLLLAGAGAGGYLYYQRAQEKRRVYRFGPIVMPERIARVPSNWSVQTLADRLKKSGKIRDASAFDEMAEKVGLKSVASGAYYLPAKASPEDLAKVFKVGPTHVKVTFPEGFTGWQIAARLEKEGFPGAKELTPLLYPAGKTPPYEGTLGPDTYLLPIDASSKSLVARLQDGFKTTLKILPRPFPTVNGKPMTTSELVTLASLIEREAAGREEMPLVAGVILNRLNKPMRLQIDAAIQYAYLLQGHGQGHKSRLTFDDYKFPSSYNLYLNDGLPPGPICNPGKSALRAAAHPAKTDALFYVYSPLLKKHRFAKTYSEHLKNVRVSAKERLDRARQKKDETKAT